MQRQQRWQYSLRALLAVTTLVAAVTAAMANYPAVGMAALVFFGIILAGRACAFLVITAPFIARWLMVLTGTVWLLGMGWLWIDDYRNPSLHDSDLWVGLTVLLVYSFFCYWVAWLIPQPATQENETRIRE